MSAQSDSDTGPNPLQWFLAELDRRPGCENTKKMVRELLRGMAGQRLFITRRDLVQPERLRMARALLDAGFTATEARRELATRAGFGQRTAERLMADALTQRAEEVAHRRHEAGRQDDSPTGHTPPTNARKASQ